MSTSSQSSSATQPVDESRADPSIGGMGDHVRNWAEGANLNDISEREGMSNLGEQIRQARSNIWGVLYRRKALVLFGIVAGLALGFLYFTKQSPVYQSTARIIVSRTSSPIPIAGAEQAGTYFDRQSTLSTQSIVIRSPKVIELALNGIAPRAEEGAAASSAQSGSPTNSSTVAPAPAPNAAPNSGDAAVNPDEEQFADSDQQALGFKGLKSRGLATLTHSGNPIEKVIGGLRVTQAGGNSDVLELSYQCEYSSDCRVILDTVVKSYIAYLGEKRHLVTQETAQLISQAKEELTTELEERRRKHREFRAKVSLLRDAEGRNVHQQRMLEIESRRSELLLERAQRQADLQAMRAAVDRGDNKEALMLMVDRSQTSESPAAEGQKGSLTQGLLPLLIEEQELLEKVGPEHPDVMAIRNKIRLTRDFLRSSDAAQTETQPGEDLGLNFLEVYMEALRQEIDAINLKENELNILFSKEQAQAKDLEQSELEDESLRKDIENSQNKLDAVVKRLEEINLIKELGGYDASEIAKASMARQTQPNMTQIMSIASFLGLMGGLALALLVDNADKRFRSPDEIRHDLRVPVFGHIPNFPKAALRGIAKTNPVSPTIITFHRPKSPFAEAYRAIRTALFFSMRGAGHRVIQVTSPMPGDGKSTLSANLAVSIAQSNKQVLLIDADFRRPRVHKIFGLKRDIGLSSVIEHNQEPGDAIQTTAVPNLSVMTCGPQTNNPSELLCSLEFEQLLATLKEKFDFVIVDTPPMLVVTDPSAVAPRVDGVLMAMRLSKKARPNAIRSVEMLSALQANILGTVVNGVGTSKSYGSGASSNGSGYYNYSDHPYSDAKAKSYYSDTSAD